MPNERVSDDTNVCVTMGVGCCGDGARAAIRAPLQDRQRSQSAWSFVDCTFNCICGQTVLNIFEFSIYVPVDTLASPTSEVAR